MGFLGEYPKYPIVFDGLSHLSFNAWTSVCLCLEQHQSGGQIFIHWIIDSDYLCWIICQYRCWIIFWIYNLSFFVVIVGKFWTCNCIIAGQSLDIYNPQGRISEYQREWGHEPWTHRWNNLNKDGIIRRFVVRFVLWKLKRPWSCSHYSLCHWASDKGHRFTKGDASWASSAILLTSYYTISYHRL